ncbi:hypothetical protein ANN_19164 [Periplaneta americana]|uniref:Uncharacterized protein n=1 Tax=Periplaneta americana TaxID=6978 RepID=A0ABQ8S9K7_PERAM|nr:hypothetical protein ANN_19164 [Periplaneta americana]
MACLYEGDNEFSGSLKAIITAASFVAKNQRHLHLVWQYPEEKIHSGSSPRKAKPSQTKSTQAKPGQARPNDIVDASSRFSCAEDSNPNDGM